MCHARLTVRLCPRVNFLCGSNGSGKSAVLAALSVCLGSSASGTGRGTSLRALVKEGQTAASVSVTIANGETAGGRAVTCRPFRPDAYGACIVVERTITLFGATAATTAYRIRNAAGVVVGTRREDVVAICEHFNFQIDNPLVVLTQETCKRFLGASTPAEKYECFLRGTQLERLAVDYAYCVERMAHVERALAHARTAQPTLDADVAFLVRRLETLQQTQTLQERRRVLQCEERWAAAHEEEARHSELRVAAADATQKAAVLRDHVNTLEADVAANAASLVDLNAAVAAHASAAKTVERERSDLRAAIESVARSEADVARSMEAMRETAASLDAEADLLKRRILAVAATDGNDARSHAATVERIAALEAAMAASSAKSIELGDQLEAARSHAATAETRANGASDAAEGARREATAAATRLAMLQRASRDVSVFYGDRMPDVLRAIEKNATRFRTHTPVGPIGVHVSVVDGARWTRAIDAIVGKQLDAFIVGCREDRLLLQQLLDACGVRTSIFTMDAAPLGGQLPQPPERILTCMRAMRFTSEAVRKLLVKIAKIHRIALVGTRHEALALAAAVPSTTPHVDSVFTADAQRVTSGGGATSVFSFGGGGRLRICDNIDAQIAAATADASRLKEVAAGLQADADAAVAAARQAADAVRPLAAKVAHCDAADEECRAHVRLLKAQLDAATAASSNAALHDDVTAVASKQTHVQTQMRHAAAKAAELAAERERHAAAAAALDAAWAVQSESAATSRTLLLGLVDRKTALVAHVERMRVKLDAAVAAADCAASEARDAERAAAAAAQSFVACALRDLAAAANGDATAALEAAATTERSVSDVAAELRDVDALLALRSLETSDADALLAELDAKSAALGELTAAVRVNTQLLASMQAALAYRRERWRAFRDGIATRSNAHFMWYLTHRAFTGRLDFDHVAKQLRVAVFTNERLSAAASSTADSKSLSGGEKSFSTVCLLLALWESVQTPFKCLDEFDVFMDSVNRTNAIDMILRYARKHRTQHIFISPLGFRLGERKGLSSADFRILRLKAPERGQTTIG